MSGRIVYHCSRRHAYTVSKWLSHIAADGAAPDFELQTYESIRDGEAPLPGTHVFTDMDRLGVEAMGRAVALARRVAVAGPGHAVANWPNLAIGRYELLRVLRARRANSFRCVRFEDWPMELRYPVFLRRDQDHDAGSQLLHDRDQLLAAAAILLVEHGWRRQDLLIVEFVDTDRIDGHFAKYSAYCAFGQVFPANMVISSHWFAKSERVGGEAALASEIEYLRSNPHARELAAIFRLANIDYGRIDYGLRQGRVETFEINTNPDLLAANHLKDELRRERILLPWQLPATRAAFRCLAAASDPATPAAARPAARNRLLGAFRDKARAQLAAAEAGDAEALFKLGTMYRSGQWLACDLAQAYRCFELAAQRFEPGDGEAAARALRARDRVERELTPEQLAHARDLVASWRPRPE